MQTFKKIFISFLLLLVVVFFQNCYDEVEEGGDFSSDPGIGDRFEDDPTLVLNCPENFITVPGNPFYNITAFCVMKYEAKQDSEDEEKVVSQAEDHPLVQVSREKAEEACKKSGYELLTNDHWQTIVRNIEKIPDNWKRSTSGGKLILSRGHSEGTFGDQALEASSDNDSCHGVQIDDGERCDLSHWHINRRTHRLSNNQVIWDMAGNVWEWVRDDNNEAYSERAYISLLTQEGDPLTYSLNLDDIKGEPRTMKDQFGPEGDYSDLAAPDYGGLGGGNLNGAEGAVIRGGSLVNKAYTGAFATHLILPASHENPTIGFRCFIPLD